jgi:hypothetical protein
MIVLSLTERARLNLCSMYVHFQIRENFGLNSLLVCYEYIVFILFLNVVVFTFCCSLSILILLYVYSWLIAPSVSMSSLWDLCFGGVYCITDYI